MIKTFTLGVCAAAILGAGALGLAGTVGAATQAPSGPGYSYSPEVKAHPAPTVTPGWHHNHGPDRIAHLQNQ